MLVWNRRTKKRHIQVGSFDFEDAAKVVMRTILAAQVLGIS